MNWSHVRLIFARELRDQLRDRRTLFVVAVLPLLLYPLLGMSFFHIAQFTRHREARILVVGAAELSDLGEYPPLLEGQGFAADLFPEGSDSTRLKVDTVEQSEWEQWTGEQRQERLQEWINPKAYQAVVVFPSTFAERLHQFREALIRRSERAESVASVPPPQVFHLSTNETSRLAFVRLMHVLDEWTKRIGRHNLEQSNIPSYAPRPFAALPGDVAPTEIRASAIWSRVLPFVVLIWALTGAFYPAIDLCAGEKERGTLETLLSCPALRTEIVWGKLLTVMLFSIVTALLNLLSMGVTGALILEQFQALSPVSRLELPPASALVWILLVLVPLSALFSALCLALAAFARSTKEGQYYLMPLLLICMPLTIMAVAPGVELDWGTSLIPVTGAVLLLRGVLEGQVAEVVPFLLPVALVTFSGCLLAVRWAVDQFNQESVLFRESERFGLGLWLRHLFRDRGATPSLALSICCVVLVLLIQFFMNLRLRPPTTFGEALQLVFISQVVVIALPAMLMAVLLTRSPRRTLLLDRFPSVTAIPLVLLLAVVVQPLLQHGTLLVQRLYPISEEIAEAGNQFIACLQAAPSPWITLLLLSLLPAVCEELTFRGFVLSGLRHIGHKWWAIGISAAAFGVVHGMLQQSIMATCVGLMLGYIAVQTGSLVPCILYHATHNGLAYLSSQLKFDAATYQSSPLLQMLYRASDESGNAIYLFRWPWVLLAAMITGYLLLWLKQLPYQRTEEERVQEAIERQATLEITNV